MSQLIKCLVIDDEPLAREGIAGYVSQTPFLELVGTCDSAISATTFLKENKVDLLFLDIQMPLLSGLDFIKTITIPPSVIFITAFSNYAIQGFELNAIDYLLKPISFDRFLKSANKAFDLFNLKSNPSENNSDFFFVKTDKKYVRINFDEITFIESIKDYVRIHTASEKHLVLLNMKNIITQLPPTKFVKVHKSFVVSLNKIHVIDGNIIKLSHGEVPIGKEYKDEINLFLQNNLIKRTDSNQNKESE